MPLLGWLTGPPRHLPAALGRWLPTAGSSLSTALGWLARLPRWSATALWWLATLPGLPTALHPPSALLLRRLTALLWGLADLLWRLTGLLWRLSPGRGAALLALSWCPARRLTTLAARWLTTLSPRRRLATSLRRLRPWLSLGVALPTGYALREPILPFLSLST